MKIESIEIYGYGKWVDKSFTDIQDLQVFYGKNEAGKSTVMSFIHSILFGFPTKQGAGTRYEPRNSSQYGGRLRISETVYGDVLIERVKGKTSGNVTVTLANGETGSEDLLEKIIFGIDKNTYQALFSFDLVGLQKVQQMNQTKLNRYFLSVGTLGNERLLRIVDKFQQEANKLYKASGRVPEINQKISQLKQKEQQLKSVKARNNEYNQLQNEKLKLSEHLKQFERQQEDLERELAGLKRLSSNWAHFKEAQEIQNQIQKKALINLPEDGLYQLKQLNDELARIVTTQIKEKEQILQLSRKAGQDERFSFYLEHKDRFKEANLKIEQIKELMKKKEIVEAKQLQDQRYLEQLLHQNGLPIYGEIPQVLSTELKAEVQNLIDFQASIQEKEANLQQDKQRLNFQIEVLNQQIDQLENQLWEAKDFQEYQKPEVVPQRQKRARKKQSKSFYAVAFSSLLSLVAGYLIGAALGVILLIVGGLGLLITGYQAFGTKREQATTKTNEKYSYEEYIKQVEIRKQWREKLAEADDVTDALNYFTDQENQFNLEKQQFNRQHQQFSQKTMIPNEVSLEKLLVDDPFFEIRQQISVTERQESEIDALTKQISEWFSGVEFSQQIIGIGMENLATFLFSFQQFYLQQVEIENAQQHISQRVAEIRQELLLGEESQKVIEKNKKSLFASVDVTSEEEFRKKYVLYQELQQKKARLDLLEDQIAEDLILFTNYRDKEELIEALQTQDETLQLLKKKISSQLKQKAECEVALKNLEEGGQYSVLLQEFANLKSELQELVQSWSSLRIAAEIIEKMLTLSRKDRLPEMIEDASHYFNLLTKKNYQRLLFKDERIQVQRQDGSIYEVNELSQGTGEQLYVALRFAFIKNATDLLKLPLLIDDGFVNFDAERRSEIFQLLNEISQTNQIVYFTCSSESQKEFSKEQVKVLQ
ncbi:ATP-binding protein [Carnobacterium maltaromaticum]|uniref:ATP-binding protein n=1 Tax=Carnobacterium maltaromaticum TaxID=2751 RepID=UPI00295EB7EB|nr:AAA family ATPase [Carnobacterium maltaromaticum]